MLDAYLSVLYSAPELKKTFSQAMKQPLFKLKMIYIEVGLMSLKRVTIPVFLTGVFHWGC